MIAGMDNLIFVCQWQLKDVSHGQLLAMVVMSSIRIPAQNFLSTVYQNNTSCFNMVYYIVNYSVQQLVQPLFVSG